MQQNNLFDISNKTFLVTGATGQIGKTICKFLIQALMLGSSFNFSFTGVLPTNTNLILGLFLYTHAKASNKVRMFFLFSRTPTCKKYFWPIKENTTRESLCDIPPDDFIPTKLTFDDEINSQDFCKELDMITDELEEDTISEITEWLVK